jgi:tetratricopeptide (TPR) repeat protein
MGRSQKLAGLHYFPATALLGIVVPGLFLTIPPLCCGAATPCAGAEQQLSAATNELERGNFAESERILSPLQASHSQCPEVVLGLGRVRAAQGDAFSAQSLLSRYTLLVPKDARGHYYLARFLFSQGEYRRSDAMLELALSFDPDYPEALTLRGQILVINGRTATAQELLERACKLAPNNVEALFQLGNLYDRNKRHVEAVTQFEKVIALNPQDPRAYDFLALNLEPLGEIEKAELAYQKGLQVNEGKLFDAFLDYNYSRFLLKRNKLVESQKHLDRALQLAPQSRAVSYEHGKLNLRLQKFEEARLDAERALSLRDPSNSILDLQVYYLLSSIYTRLGKDELARKYIELSQTTPVPIQARERN